MNQKTSKTQTYSFPYSNFDRYSAWCSGGADSSLLLYYLLKSGKPVDVYTVVSTSTPDKNTDTIRNVVLKAMEITGNYKVRQHIIYNDEKREADLRNMTIPYFGAGMIDKLYTGVTANPPAGEIKQFQGVEDLRDPKVTRPIEPNPYAITPFTNFDKKWIAERYKEEGLMETLFPVTNSCEDLTINKNKVGIHCGECWWCKERQWAFGRLS